VPKKVLGGPKGSRISLRVVATDLRNTLDRRRSDGIAKSDSDLHRELRPVEMEGHADTSVIRILGEALGSNRVGNRRRARRLRFSSYRVLERCGRSVPGIVSPGEEGTND